MERTTTTADEPKEVSRLLDEIGQVYLDLAIVYQSMILSNDDTTTNVNELESIMHTPKSFTETIRRNNHLMRQQAYTVGNCLKRLEALAPDLCNLNYD